MTTDEHWRLADYYDTVGEEEFVIHIIESEEQLENVLEMLISGDPRIAELYSPNGIVLRLYIGGKHAGLVCLLPQEMLMLLTTEPTAPRSVEFEIQGQPSILDPDELHPPSNIIDVVWHYFMFEEFPAHLKWRSYKR